MKIDMYKLNDACDIREVWRRAGLDPLIKKGASFKARCLRPENHKNGDKHPSLIVGGKKNIAWCPVCDFHWNPVDLVAQTVFKIHPGNLQNETFYKVCAWLADHFLSGDLPLRDGSHIKTREFLERKQARDAKQRSTPPIPPSSKTSTSNKPRPTTKSGADQRRPPPEPDSRALFQSRKAASLLHSYGLTDETIRRAGLGLYRHHALGHGIIYPAPPGNPVAWKFKTISRNKNGKRKCLFLEGDKEALFGAESIQPGRPMVVTGGEEKCLLLRQLGFPAVSPLFGENNLYESQAEMIVSARPSRVVIALDADPAGKSGAITMGRRLIQAGLLHTRLFALAWPDSAPPGYDVNDLYNDGGKQAVLESIRNAAQFTPPVYDFTSVNEKSVFMSEVEAMDVDWLWEPWIPRGMITLLTGDPNSGKTWLALQICAIVSRNYNFPDAETGLPAEVLTSPGDNLQPASHNPRSDANPPGAGLSLYLTYEDHLNITLKKRLDIMDCDQSRIAALLNHEGNLRLDRPERIEYLLSKYHPQIMVFDPLTAALGEHVNMNSAEEVTRLLTPIAKLAEIYNCAILLIRHQSKADRENVLHRGMGSIAFSGVARSEILLGRDPEDARERVIFLIKCAEKEASPIAYRCDGCFEWCGLSDLTPEDLNKRGKGKKKKSKRDQAAEWLLERLSDGPVMASKIFDEAENHDPPFSIKTLKRIKNKMEIESLRVTEGNNGSGVWMWRLFDEVS